MNPSAFIPLITALGSVLSVVVAGWTMMAHFDKRNTDRFDAMQRQIEGVKEVLRAEMKEMRAEIRLEIREASDRRIGVK